MPLRSRPDDGQGPVRPRARRGTGAVQMRSAIKAGVRRSAIAALVLGLLLLPALALTHGSYWSLAEPLHYAPNGNFGADGKYVPDRAGFNLADVSSAAQLAALGADVKALVWVGQCNGADEKFREAVQPFLGNPKVFGFYLMDDPDPRGMLEAGKLSVACTPDNLRAESDWIHDHAPGAKTFIALMNLSSSAKPSYENSYSPANSHVDLFGIAPYPCRTELHGCDYDMIDHYVDAAISAGIPPGRIVPYYQSFGGSWSDGDGGRYLLPTAEQARLILGRWRRHVGSPEFDAAYSWGSQREDTALESAPDLQHVFLEHNHARDWLTWPMR